MTAKIYAAKKILVLDGISGVPLGREITQCFLDSGHTATHFDCLKEPPRALHGIRSAGAKVINKQSDRDGFYLLPKLTPQTLHALIEREAPTHILIIGFIYKFFNPKELRRAADAHCAVLWLYDTDSCNLYDKRREFIFFIENELPVYDHIFSFSQVTTRFFRETRNLPATHLPFGANPIDVRRNNDKEIEVLFVGSGDFRRILLLEAIRKNVTIYGNRWRRNFPLISHELQARITDTSVWGSELHDLLAKAKIVLNITRTDFYGAETGVNLRIFEAVAAGCFLLTDYCEEIEDLFEVGREIETFRSSVELANKVRYYLENDNERMSIARRGHARFVRCHTWRSRMEQVQFLDTPRAAGD